MAFVLSSVALSVLLSRVVFADLVPTAPGPGEIFIAGDNCTIRWNADQSGTWENVTIDLMSGSNTNMSRVTNVVSGLDGTDATLTPFNWTCPEVDPYSTVYFYQFTNGGQVGQVSWTTRFTIASPNGEYVDPDNSQQPNGDPIPWGTGSLALVDDEDDDDTPPSCMSLEQMERMVDAVRLSRRHSNKEDSGDSSDDSGSDDSETNRGKSPEDADKKSGDNGETRGSKTKAVTSSKATHKDDAEDDEDTSDASPTPSVHKVSATHASAKVTHTATVKSASEKSDASPTTSAQKSAKSSSGVKAKASSPSEAADSPGSSSSSAAPTPGLPKKAHSSGSNSASPTKAAQDSDSTCQCSAGQRGGIEINRSEARMVSVWALVIPLFTGLVALC